MEDQREIRDGTLTIRAMDGDAVLTLTVTGELDLANVATLATELETAERSSHAITLDMSELEFIDSTGIALLVSAHRRLNQNGDRFRLIPSEASAVQRVMTVTGLNAKLPFVSLRPTARENELPPSADR